MLSLFFVDDLPVTMGENYEFSNEDAQHAIRVLRMQPGAEFILCDGQGSWAQVRALEFSKKSIQVQVLEIGFEEPLPIKITVVQALPKGDRAKEAIELLTQSGVDQIIPWSAKRSIGKGTDKFVITAREASKQSRRFRVPVIAELATTQQVCQAITSSDLALVFHESASKKLSDQIGSNNPTNLLIVIGPEGGITDEELAAFEAAGAIVALMGRPVFRSAHAGIAAVSALSALLKVW